MKAYAANDDCIIGGPSTRTKYVYDVITNGRSTEAGAGVQPPPSTI